MTDRRPIRTVGLDNGISLRFFDSSNRYFGDFHRVLVLVEGGVNTDSILVPDALKTLQGNRREVILYHCELERMGVTSALLETTISDLIDSFLGSTKSYLERPEVPVQLIKKRLAEQGRRRRSSLLSTLQGGKDRLR